jgi:hypothetical protein
LKEEKCKNILIYYLETDYIAKNTKRALENNKPNVLSNPRLIKKVKD